MQHLKHSQGYMCLIRLLIIIGHLYLSDMWLSGSTKTDIKKRFDYRLKYDKHSKLNSGHNWDDLYDHFMTMRIFTLIMNQDIHMSSENCEESGYGLDLDLQTISY